MRISSTRCFWDDAFNRVDLLFEIVCTLVRANGMRDTGRDLYYESLALLEDLKNLQLIAIVESKGRQTRAVWTR
jgi:hypothetical protein